MAIILSIETATEVCSAAIARDGKLIALEESIDGFKHSEKLTLFIEELFRKTEILPAQLDAVCVSKGPGSYTGLRIGVSTAKGLCYALNIPLIAVGTLGALAHHIAHDFTQINIEPGTLLCPMLDARRMEVYTALFDYRGLPLTDISAKIIDAESFGKELENHKIVFFGNGAEKCKSTINHPSACFVDNLQASARFMKQLAEENFNKKQFEDVAYFEPFYLKDFIATTPKNKIL